MEPAKHDTRYQTKIREKEAEKGEKRSEEEVEKYVRMEEKEVTSVEDVEELLTPTEIDKPAPPENLTLQDMVRPVSYTHLDVYKRQIINNQK